MSFLKLNMMSWIFYYDLLLMSLIGSLLVVYNIDNHYIIDKISNESTRLYGFVFINYTLIGFSVGMYLSNKLFKSTNIKAYFIKYTCSGIQYERNDRTIHILLLGLSFICVGAVLYVLYVLKEIPLLNLFSKNHLVSELSEFRIDVSRHFPGNEYVKNILASTLTPLLSFIALAYYLRNRTFINKIWFLVMVGSSILILTYNYAKAPIVYYFIGFLFFYVYYKGAIPKKYFLFSIFICFLLIIMAYKILADGNIAVLDLFLNYNTGISGRILLSQISGVFLSVDLFPRNIDHLYFTSFSNFLASIFDLNYSERSARLLMEYANPGGIKNGTAGVLNSLFIGEAWANFGWMGIMISPIYVGFLIQSLYLFFLRNKKTPLMIGLLVTFSYKGSITGGFNDYIYNPNFFILVFLFAFIYFISNFLNQFFNYKRNDKKNNISSAL